MDKLKLHTLPAGEAYKKLERLIWKTVHCFIRRYGIPAGEFDELMGEASIAFTRAYSTYNPALMRKGKKFHLGGYVQTCVWRRLHLVLKPRIVGEELYKHIPERKDLLVGLSQDADTVIRLLFNETSNQRNARKSALIRALLELGWTGARIAESFHEIKTALLG